MTIHIRPLAYAFECTRLAKEALDAGDIDRAGRYVTQSQLWASGQLTVAARRRITNA